MPTDNPTDSFVNYLEQLLSLGRTLNSSLQQEEVLNLTINSVVEFVQAERGFILLFNDNEYLELKACKNVNPEAIRKMQGISKTILNAAVQGDNIISLNAQSDPRFSQMESVVMVGMRSVLCVPLRVKDRIIGVIYLDNKIEDMFNDHHLSMLVAFANQAAVAIENARLHENLIRSYDEQLRLKEELYEQEKIRYACEKASTAKSDFVNIVSHELRSPLTVIKNYTTILQRDAQTGRNTIASEMKMDIYQTIDTEVDRLLSMINKLLDVSRIEAGKPMILDLKKVKLHPVISHVLKLQRTSKFYKEGLHTIKEEIQEELPEIVCDQGKIAMILSNLLENALKYSPDGGTVTLRIFLDDKYLNFFVSDDGIGISEEEHSKIFEKFERMDHSGRTIPGTGLGLFLVKNLVELHGGTVRATSKRGKGSVFSFNIPRKRKKEFLGT